jgi:hypothetical protein
MKIYFEFNGSRFMKMVLLSAFTIYVEHNFPDYSAYLIIAASILLSFTIRIDR